MKIEVTRRMSSKKYIFSMDISNSLTGEANYTLGIFPIKIAVLQDENVYELKQTNFLLKFINALPILNLETFTPFKFYVNGIYKGKTKKSFFRPVFYLNIDKDTYELRLHNDNFISIMKNKTQIALIKKDSWSTKEKNTYYVKFDENSDVEYPMILMFCAFVDMIFYPQGLQVSYKKYERTYVPRDKYIERIYWRNEEDDMD